MTVTPRLQWVGSGARDECSVDTGVCNVLARPQLVSSPDHTSYCNMAMRNYHVIIAGFALQACKNVANHCICSPYNFPAHIVTCTALRQSGTGKTRNDMGNGKRGIRNSKHSATELAVTIKSQAYRLAVVLQPSLLC